MCSVYALILKTTPRGAVCVRFGNHALRHLKITRFLKFSQIQNTRGGEIYKPTAFYWVRTGPGNPGKPWKLFEALEIPGNPGKALEFFYEALENLTELY